MSLFRLILKVPYFKNRIIGLLTACVSATWCNNGYSMTEAQRKFDHFLKEQKLL